LRGLSVCDGAAANGGHKLVFMARLYGGPMEAIVCSDANTTWHAIVMYDLGC
jgi:hypothetical protein